MERVRCMTLKNNGNFVARIKIKGTHTNGKTYTYEQSGYHDICKYAERTVDLADTNGKVQPGDVVTMFAFVKLGKDKTAKESFVYAPDSIQNAKYSIKGTTLSNSLKFEGIKGKDPVQVAPKFPEVGSFKLINKGNFVVRMQIIHADPNSGKTAIYEPSGYHDICKYAERTIDLSKVSEIKNGEIVTLRAFVVLGKDIEASETYTFKKGSGVMATYEISGNTLTPKIKKV